MSDNNDSFQSMIKEFKSMTELKKFSEAQHKTLIELGKKLKALEDENKALKETGAAPKQSTAIITDPNISDGEIICHTQLNILKQVAQDRELTLEEAKKVDIYSKILVNLKAKDENPGKLFSNLKDEDLLKLVENES